MSYWRMQLHPNEPEWAAYYTIHSLASGFIGLDFGDDPGDLEQLEISELEANPNNIRAFVHEIHKDDHILIFLHHQPFALVTEIGPYNYIKRQVEKLDIWFRHFREVKGVWYYADAFGKVRAEDADIIMTNTFSGVSPETKSGKLLEEWVSMT